MPFLTDTVIRALPSPAKGNKVHFDQPSTDVPGSADAVVPGLGVKITATGRRTWGLYYRLRDGSGTQRWLTIGRFPLLDTTAARKRARELRREIELGGDPQGDKATKRREPTVNVLADLWEVACARKVRAEMLRASTVDGYERALRLHIRPHLGKLKITAVTKKTVARFHEQITLDGLRVQANRSVMILSSMMAWAVSEELLAVNPCIKAFKMNTEEARAREIEPEECQRFVAELARHDTQSARAIQLLMLTGARRNEVTSMRWGDLVLGGDAPEWRRQGSRLKGKRNHTVPLNGPARQLLVTIRDEALAKDSVLPDFVFPSDTVTGYIRDIRKMWLLILRRAGIADLTPHDLRHHFASVMVSSGSSQALVAAMLAHASLASSARYVHAFKDAKREASERTAATIMGGTSDDNVVPLKRGA